MMDFRPILQVVGLLVAALGVAMIVPAIVDFFLDSADWIVFASSSLVTLFTGIAFWAASRGADPRLSVRQAFVLTIASWVALATFGALPLVWSELGLSFTDAFFESMSGLTTTGSTVIVGLDLAPPGLLLWRGILQWLGGLGIIVMAIAVMPMLQVGGMQLFKVEAFDTSEKILPRATQISGQMTLLYGILTLVCVFAYDLAGMRFLDAVVHGMTTIATGGFSTHDASIGFYENPTIEVIAIVFMIVGSLPFILYLKAMNGSFTALGTDSQVRVFLLTLAGFIVLAAGHHVLVNGETPGLAFRHALFNMTSTMTGTGYAATDTTLWGPFSIGVFFIAMFVGGCAGSTSCGIKIFRFQVLFENVQQHLKRVLYPSGIFPKRYNDKPLSDAVVAAVMT
ncbi:MAG: TrkH family potassium uptake protein, partial [Pseudomonadota bacterium]